MFKRSIIMVLGLVVAVFASAFTTQMVLTQELPSSYDSGLSIEQAFKTSKVPLLIEFYTDTCGSCRKLTPVIHDLHEKSYKNQLTVVMMDATDPGVQQIGQLFGVDALPALYVFDHKHMKKHQIKPEEFSSKEVLQHAIDTALAKTRQ